jgi:adenylate cyclase
LAAILAADVAGYSRLMGEDEEGTLVALTSHLADLIEPCIAEHRGRIVKTTGDGLLVEFPSVVDAVRSAVAFQEGMAERNIDVPEGRKMLFRIGINLGEVIVQDHDVYGDGVNIAARLEGLAAPGGIVVSHRVHDEIRGRLDLNFSDLGSQTVKNIAEPVRAWHLAPGGAPVGKASSDRRAQAETDMASIAVLPFQNMSGDAEQEYFADGMVEEIITALSRFRWLLVMARNSSFAYKGRAADVRTVANELGVRYVLEGSVRRAGDRVRITGQLIDAATGAHIWADRFDGSMADIFDLQDEITAAVVGAIEPSLRRAEIDRSLRKHPESLTAYDLFLRALGPLNRLRPDANAEALGFLERAIALDPGHAPTLAYAAFCYEQRILHGWSDTREEDTDKAVRLAREALAIDSGDAGAIAMASFVMAIVGHDWDAARVAARRALDINPNSVDVCWKAGWVILFDGDVEGALEPLERSLRLSPSDPLVPFLLNAIGMCHLIQDRPEEALEAALRSAALSPDIDVTYYIMVPAAALLGRTEELERAKAKLTALAPGVTVSSFENRMPFRRREHLDILLDGLRKAGLPE